MDNRLLLPLAEAIIFIVTDDKLEMRDLRCYGVGVGVMEMLHVLGGHAANPKAARNGARKSSIQWLAVHDQEDVGFRRGVGIRKG